MSALKEKLWQLKMDKKMMSQMTTSMRFQHQKKEISYLVEFKEFFSLLRPIEYLKGTSFFEQYAALTIKCVKLSLIVVVVKI